MEAHPLANMVPEMTSEEFDEFVEDIQTNGLMVPIITFGGKILDGRHRFKACEKAGVSPTFTEYKGTTPAALVLSLNCKRRNLTQPQLALLAARMLPELEKEAAANVQRDEKGRITSPDESSGGGHKSHRESTTKASKAIGVGRTSVQQAKRLLKAAASGDIQAVKAVKNINTGKTKTIRQGIREAFPDPKPKPAPPVIFSWLSLASDTGMARNHLIKVAEAFSGANLQIDGEMLESLVEYLDEMCDIINGIRSILTTNTDDALKAILDEGTGTNA